MRQSLSGENVAIPFNISKSGQIPQVAKTSRNLARPVPYPSSARLAGGFPSLPHGPGSSGMPELTHGGAGHGRAQGDGYAGRTAVSDTGWKRIRWTKTVKVTADVTTGTVGFGVRKKWRESPLHIVYSKRLTNSGSLQVRPGGSAGRRRRCFPDAGPGRHGRRARASADRTCPRGCRSGKRFCWRRPRGPGGRRGCG